jgi:adenosine deaminase
MVDTTSTNIEQFIETLPKAELHLHLEGSLEPEMVFLLARRNGIPLRWQSEAELRAAYDFANLQEFLTLYFEGCRVLVHERDFYEATLAYLTRASTENVRRAEIFIGPQSFTERGVPIEAVMCGVLGAIEDARAATGLSAGVIVSVHRHRPAEEALRLLDSVAPWLGEVIGVGMGGPEINYPPGRFKRFFAKAKALGYRTTVHAGEEGPAPYIQEALRELNPDRIDHGVAALQSNSLTRELAERKIPLTVCPLSNVRLKVCPSLGAHPLKALLRSGIRVSVHSDDPPYFGGYVNENYLASQEALHLSVEDVAELARNSFLSSFAPQEEIQDGVDMVDAHLAEFNARSSTL